MQKFLKQKKHKLIKSKKIKIIIIFLFFIKCKNFYTFSYLLYLQL